MLDKILNIGCTLDWISPTFAFLQDFFQGHPADFGISANSYWGRREIKWLLKSYGINVWGLMYNFDGDVLMFTVQAKHAEMAYSILSQERIPLLFVPIDFIEYY